MKNGLSLDVLVRHNVATGAMLAFRSSYKDIILPIPYGCMHDTWIATIAASYGGLFMIDEPLIKYRQHIEQQIGAKYNGSTIQHFSREFFKLIQNYNSYLYKSKQESLGLINSELLLYRSLKKRLLNINPELLPLRMRMIDEKIGHLEERLEINDKKRVDRILPIFKEVTASRYRYYSNGLAFTIKDLIL
jgi:predicted metal-dependent hydrolase